MHAKRPKFRTPFFNQTGMLYRQTIFEKVWDVRNLKKTSHICQEQLEGTTLKNPNK